ncbi:MAG TPA: hypothetical protein VF128_15030 [Gemmatimonadaceae bacterium]
MKRVLNSGMIAAAVFVAAGFTLVRSDLRIETRVDARIRAEVAAIADSLEREGLKPEPLVDYALEGTQKGGSPQKILAGVKKWARDLRYARQLLGPNASPLEVNLGAKAIRAGVDVKQLERLRDARNEHRYASALTTMHFLVSSGVPADTASTVVVNLALQGASESQIAALQDDIERDIKGGTPPGLSTVGRAVGLIAAMTAESDSTNGVVPGAALPSTRGTARPADPMANGSPRGSAVGSQGTGARPPAPRGKDSKRPPP